MNDDLSHYLDPAPAIDCDRREMFDLARSIARGSKNDVQAGVRLFEYVRDTIRYNPYVPFWRLEFYTAQATLDRGKGFCVQKAALLVSLARAIGIPARLGFGDIRNHLLPQSLADYLGSDIMTFHSWAELFLAGKWVKATPPFDSDLCRENGWRVVEFDGRTDAMLPATDLAGRPHISYLKVHFSSPGVPLEDILAAWAKVYGPDRLVRWRRELAPQFGVPEEI